MTNGPNISLHSQGKTRLSLLIPHITADILGVYSCTASNTHGHSRKENILRGRFEPNDFLYADKTIPGVPQSPIMTPHQEQKLSNILQYTLSWSTLTPFPVVEYHLKYRKWSTATSDKWWNIVVPERKLPQQFMVTSDYTLRGLLNKVTYEVMIAAVNIYGMSEWSRSSLFSVAQNGELMILHC